MEIIKKWINEAVTVGRVRAGGNAALGFINSMNMVVNAMICKENNEFTSDFGEWLDEQERVIRIYVNQRCIMLESEE